jgi:tetratricopeptide (TPR) repeat protein
MGSVPYRLIALAFASLACVTAGANVEVQAPEAALAVDEITDPVTPPGPRVIDAAGKPQPHASPLELRAGGHFYYRSGALDHAYELYEACFAAADGELRAACLWGMGAVRIAEAQRSVAEGLHEDEGCVRRNPPAPLECTIEAQQFEWGLVLLRLANRGDPTARRALVIGTIYEQLGNDAEALHFYQQGLVAEPQHSNLAQAVAQLRARGPRPKCPECMPQPGVQWRPRDCPSLPFDWHRRTGELAIVGSELEGVSRDRILACFGEPHEAALDTWSYVRRSCTETGARERFRVRLRFESDVVVAVTHERTIEERQCSTILLVE